MTNFIPAILFILLFFIGLILVLKWRKGQDDPDRFFFSMIWALISLSVYLLILEIMHGS